MHICISIYLFLFLLLSLLLLLLGSLGRREEPPGAIRVEVYHHGEAQHWVAASDVVLYYIRYMYHIYYGII